MTTIYTSKKTGATFILVNEEVNVDLNGNSKTIYTLASTEDAQDTFRTTESVLKRWYKKSIEVDFTDSEEPAEPETETTTPSNEEPEPQSQPEEKPSKKTSKKAKKSKKESKPRAKTYEEQTWGLTHTRLSIDEFCKLFELSGVEYDSPSSTILIHSGTETVASRRAWKNEVTGSAWFRFKNHEYELTDLEY